MFDVTATCCVCACDKELDGSIQDSDCWYDRDCAMRHATISQLNTILCSQTGGADSNCDHPGTSTRANTRYALKHYGS